MLSQGWCAALGVPVPTPYWLQEFLLGMHDDQATASQHAISIVGMMITMEISEMDRRFHEDVMRGQGQWWKDPNVRPLSFRKMWKMLELRTKDVRPSLVI